MLYEDFDAKKRIDGESVFTARVPQYIPDNLNPESELREYQKEALGRLEFYLKDYSSKKLPVHLLFNMATGSGKTLVMAGALIHLYKLGYREFIFFVNSTNIIKKTKENFLNSKSIKYLFSQKIVVDGKEIKVNSVENFSASDKDNINIYFTTIHGLHARVNDPREETLTIEDFEERNVVLLSDEAHHINALTRARLTKEEELEKTTWEGTVQKIMKKNPKNILLEFTATLDMDNTDIADKYKDKLIYKYDLAQFRSDGFSKDIHVAGIDLNPLERAIGALILSQYRRKVAERKSLILKPVVLMKSKSIKESEEFEEVFHITVKNLKIRDISKFKTRGSRAHLKAFEFFEKEKISLADLVKEIKDEFAPEKCISVNSKDDSEEKQILVNTLEDRTNPIRLVFAVDKLNEGWDVLNLFDIVRLYETRDARANQPGKTTMAEAQLIGRGARYWPFTLNKDKSNRFLRKFDEDLENDLRIIEELHYHTKFDSKYIDEIKKALVKTGALPAPENTREYQVRIKDEIKDKIFWKEGLIFLNEKLYSGRRHIKSLKDIPELPERFVFDLHKGGGQEILPFDNTGVQLVRETTTRDIMPIEATIWREAIYRFPFYKFNMLITFFPNIKSIREFVESKSYLSGLAVAVRGEQMDVNNISREDILYVCLDVLDKIEKLVRNNTDEFEGTKMFTARPLKQIAKDKSIKVVVNDSEQEFGVPMKEARDMSLRLDLKSKDWYLYDENYGTKEEKEFVHFIHDAMADLESRYEEVCLLRNERLFKIFRFSDGAAVEPDFVLFLYESAKKNTLVYQIFIEPKGDFLLATDKWKEDFLKEIEASHEIKVIFENKDFRIVGLPFYNHSHITEFEEAFSEYRSTK